MISVVIPVFNRRDLLPLTLRSLLNQTVAAAEILVVDDGSTDGSAEVAEFFGGSVRVIRKENGGPAAARNLGFKESKGDYIHFFDSDDVALPNKHEVQLRALESEKADIAYGPWVKGRLGEGSFEAENLVLQQRGLPKDDLVKALLTNWSTVPHACLFRREIVEKSGGFPTDLWVAEDQMMFLKCLLAGAKVAHSPGTLELYRSDNVGKITDSSQDAGRNRHLTHWSRFLVLAEETCRKEGINPGEWFGFRGRVSKALSDLQKYEIEEPEIEKELRRIVEGRPLSWAHRVVGILEQKRQGLEVRLGRGRAHRSFRIGPIEEIQQAGIREWSVNESQSLTPLAPPLADVSP